MKTISFKSTPPNWIIEDRDIKRNTVRVVDKDDIRHEVLEEFISGIVTRLDVELIATTTCDISTKKVLDVTKFWVNGSVYVFIISW